MTAIGIAHAGPDALIDGIIDAIECTAPELGLTARRISRPEDEGMVDLLLLVGFPRSYAAFLEAPRGARRVAWFGEPLPRPTAVELMRRPRYQAMLAVGLQAAKRTVGPITRRTLPGQFGHWREAAAIAAERISNLADARWCAGLVDRVVVTSRDRARVLAQHAIDAAVVPFGYHPAWAGPLAAPGDAGRDIAIVVVGSGTGAPRLRRGRILARVAPALESLGTVAYLEGVWGAERDAILRRARVVVDIHRVPGNFTGLRLLTSLAAGALPVTEPLDDPHPFMPGVDHVAVPAEEIVGAVATVLGDEPARQVMAAAGQARLVGELSMRSALQRVLAA